MKSTLKLGLPLLVFGVLVAVFAKGLTLKPSELPSVRTGKPLPEFHLPNLLSQKVMSNTDLPQGRFLLNVWASWCPNCLAEHQYLMQLKRKGVTIVGLNYKDNPEQANQWLQLYGNPYQIILQDLPGNTAIDLGVYGAPETFLIDENKTILFRHTGSLDESTWQSIRKLG